MKKTKILGIESSCDECSASIIEFSHSNGWPKYNVLSVATFSQVEIHRPYGGVVPEIASRNHLETMNPMIDRALEEAAVSFVDLDAIAVTNRPGLVGALLVGVSAAKALAYTFAKPLVPVHHLEGHISSIFLDSKLKLPIQLPLLVAVISGGHTNLYVLNESPLKWKDGFLKDALVASSRDDAAGEAFDKTAKLLGFPYPGGAELDRNSKGGDPEKYPLPKALPQKSVLDFSFSGLKTASAQLIDKVKKERDFEARRPDLCASIQEAIIEMIVRKMKLAVKKFNCETIAISGGVAANSRLRTLAKEEFSVPVHFASAKYCTDNAAMIAAAGGLALARGEALNKEDLLRLNAVASADR